MDETVSERDRNGVEKGLGWQLEKRHREGRERREEEGRIQGHLFASGIKMHTGVCLGDVPFIRCIKN